MRYSEQCRYDSNDLYYYSDKIQRVIAEGKL